MVEQNDPLALANALAELLRQPVHAQMMGAAARQKVEQVFDVRQNVATLHTWLAEQRPEHALLNMPNGQHQPVTPVNGMLPMPMNELVSAVGGD